MNNGVENNQVAEPILTPIVDNTEPATVPLPVVPDTNIVVPSGAEESYTTPAPVFDATNNTPTFIPAEEVTQTIEVSTTDNSENTVENTEPTKEKKEKKKMSLPVFFFFIMVLLVIGLYFSFSFYKRDVSELRYKCSPITESKEEVHLDVNSTLVQDLYHKVATSLREDVAQPEWNDTMRIYLAYRQIPDYQMYDTNCNLYKNELMEPYTCEVSLNSTPKAFKVSTLELEWKKLYGEDTEMPKINIKLTNGCVGGFQYIPEREEYVQGYCKQGIANAYKVSKKVTDAVSSRNMIVITEEVKYSTSEKMTLPDSLHSGTYYYTFRLDMNYNYV